MSKESKWAGSGICRLWLITAGILLVILAPGRLVAEPTGDGVTTVVWVSMDGVRPDYLQRAELPFLQTIMQQSAYCDEVIPCFPSITFPSHASIATGVYPDQHGVVANTFYDRSSDRVHRYPWYDDLLLSEPLWRSATRQGVEVAVFDWPLSHDQQGEHAARYFGHRYQQKMDGEQRLGQVVDAYRHSISEGRPLRLMMGYLPEPDSSGHRYGPEDPRTMDAFQQAEAQLHAFYQEVRELWAGYATSEDTLVLLVTSDHGMAEVTWVVNPELLTGLGDREDLLLIGAGNVLQVYSKQPLDTEAADQLQLEMELALANYPFAALHRGSDLPAEWRYDHPQRTADFIVMLAEGYAFNRRATEVVVAVAEVGGPRGMHGYDPATDPHMHTVALMWVEPQHRSVATLSCPLTVVDFYALVCDLLGIEMSFEPCQAMQKR